MKQTAVEWLVEQFNSEEFIYRDRTTIIEQAKEIEKQQGYSEEDMRKAFNGFKSGKSFNEWFEQFKNK